MQLLTNNQLPPSVGAKEKSKKGILWASPQQFIDIAPRYANTPQAPHVTLQYGIWFEDWEHWLGIEFKAQLLYEAWNGRVQAIALDLAPNIACSRQHPHLTVSWVDAEEPIASNRMLATKFNYLLLSELVDFKIEFFEFKQ